MISNNKFVLVREVRGEIKLLRSMTAYLNSRRFFGIVIYSAPYPSGKGEVCKTFMHQFDSDRRL